MNDRLGKGERQCAVMHISVSENEKKRMKELVKLHGFGCFSDYLRAAINHYEGEIVMRPRSKSNMYVDRGKSDV